MGYIKILERENQNQQPRAIQMERRYHLIKPLKDCRPYKSVNTVTTLTNFKILREHAASYFTGT